MKQRIISAIIALIIFIPLFLLGNIYFKLLLTILSLLSIKEILDINKKTPNPIKVISYLITGILVFLDIDITLKILITVFIYLLSLVIINDKKYNLEDSMRLITFTIVIILLYTYMIMIRNKDINVLIYLFLITILTDTFAYIGGRLFGRRKLIENISPNKTKEGSIIGSGFGTAIPAIFYLYMIEPGGNFIIIMLITFILSIIGQLGDLVFSYVKRYYKIKDFSNIMPGHGGILDRFDSITFVIFAYMILFNFI